MPFAVAQNNNPLEVVTSNISACGSYTWPVNGQTYTSSTVVTVVNITNDTLFVLNLTVNSPYVSHVSITSNNCQYNWRGENYYHTGLYYDTVHANTTLGTCDSFFSAQITIPTVETAATSVSHCGEYTWHGNTYDVTGVYTDTTIIQNPDLTECTHVDVLNLILVDTIFVDDNVQHCGTYNWYGTDYTESGVYTHVESNTVINCDTLHTMSLTIVVDTARVQADSACGYYTWRGTRYETSGVYGVNDTNTSTGCVTYRSINLKIKAMRTPVRDTFMVGCNGVNFNVTSLAASTTKRFYNDTIFDTNIIDRRWARCYDSTIHLHVTIHKSGYDTTYVNACDSFYWNLNKKTYKNTPTTDPSVAFATDTFGCDSMMVLRLTINKSPVISAINGEWYLHTGDTAVLYPTCTEGASYKWTYGNRTSTADTLRFPITADNANIDVSLEATYNYPANNVACHDTSWITIVTYVGIDEVEGTQVTLYPNPTVGQLNIESAENIREVVIYNALGQKVVNSYNLGNSSTMNLSSLTKGTYTMSVRLQNGETIVRKFIIAK